MTFKRLFLIVLCSAGLMGCASNQGGTYLSSLTESNQQKGVRYLLGHGVTQDNKQAFHYFQLAANQGDAFSQNELGYLYAAGKGTKRDYAKSVYWYEQAAAQNLASAQYSLAYMYKRGLGVPRNPTKVKELLKKSAAHGFKPAVIALEKDA